MPRSPSWCSARATSRGTPSASRCSGSTPRITSRPSCIRSIDMDFDPPAAVRPLLDRVAKFVTDVVVPAEREVLERGFSAAAPQLAEMRARCKSDGLWAPQLPKELGGLGLGLVEHGLVSEQLGRSPLG